ncbi:ABC transporter substrate-binding protein [Actinomycetes bacterium KLBMP 9759]
MHVSTRSLPAALAGAALAVSVLAGCSAGGDGSGGTAPGAAPTAAAPAATKDDALAKLVPANFAGDGKLIWGTDASYPPNEFTDTDGTTIVGMDIEIARAVSEKLGLTAEFQNSQFSGIIPGVEGDKYEAAISSFSVNAERIKTVDMISYYSAGTSLGVKPGNPEKLDPEKLCGKAIGVQAGTTQAEEIVTKNKACTDAGQPAIAITELQQQTDVTLALTSSRIVGMLADSPVVAYAVQQTNGAVEVVGKPYATSPYGIVIGKNKGEYSKAIQGAVQALIKDGTYKKILDKWNGAAGAITEADVAVNPAVAS